jgi:Uma2 family endonuclease
MKLAMTQAKPKFSSFEEYLAHSDRLEGRFEFIEGELIELPPESRPNAAIANYLFLILVQAGIPFNLIYPGKCEIQVPVLEPKDPANRFPDLVVLREEHLALTERRLTITIEMPPPQLVVEVVSPGKTNRDRDYLRKRSQYAAQSIPEFWLIDSKDKIITVLELQGDDYIVFATFQASSAIVSPSFGQLPMTAEQVFAAGR